MSSGEAPAVFTTIGELRPYMKNINVAFIVLEKESVSTTKDGHRIAQFLVGDVSGVVIASFWDEIGDLLRPSDIVHLYNGYCTLHHGMMSLQRGKTAGRVEKVGEFTMPYSEQPHMSRMLWDEDPATKTWTFTPDPNYHPPQRR